ncbi:MAG: hypothetical protein HYY04_00360 [Chloroflexi bacterium]|nr:hypothetical protein [Chloroflexota bacterium]
MNQRERLRTILNLGKPDRLPVWDLEGVAEGTVRQWCLEGLPLGRDVSEYLGLERAEMVPVDTDPIPTFVPRTIGEDAESVTTIDNYGFTVRTLKERAISPKFYYYIQGSVASREDWQRMKRRYEPHDIRRYPKAWSPDLVEHYRTSPRPIGLRLTWGPGRGIKNGHMLGLEKFLQTIYDDPAFVEDIFDFWADFAVELLRPLLEQTTVDFMWIHEDGVAYKNSTLISPATYRKLWFPYVRRVVDFVRGRGVRVVGHYTSGNIAPLIPSYLQTGINLFAPLECAAGLDAVALRRTYGQDVLLMGNVAREALMGDRAAVEKEFYGKVPWLVERGGYVPAPDDMILPDMPLDTVRHYTRLVRDLKVG